MKTRLKNTPLLSPGGIFLCLLFCHTSLVAASDCVATTAGIESMHRETVTLLNDVGKPLSIEVLVADDARERAAGFQSVCPSVIDNTLILFQYPGEIAGKFHMQNVKAPLDIGFFDRNGRLLKYLLMETYTETAQPLYGPGKPFQYALEARVGFFAEHDISAFPSQLLIKP